MQKFLTAAIVAGMSFGAYAAGENVVSSKAYVDSGVAQKQGIISKAANDNSAMLFPTTTGGTARATFSHQVQWQFRKILRIVSRNFSAAKKMGANVRPK